MEDWRVALGLQPDDPEDLRKHLSVFYPEERHHAVTWLVQSPLGESERQLLIDVAAGDPDAAEKVAMELYEKARGHAGLETKRFFVLGYSRLDEVEPRADRLLATAQYRVAGGLYSEGVVMAQTACEVRAQQFFDRAVEAQLPLRPFVRALPRTLSLRDPVGQAVFESIASRRIVDEEWWPSYAEHCRRRNGIVHQGFSVMESDAESSLSAAGHFMNCLAEFL